MSGGFKGRSKVKHLALFSEQPKRREKNTDFSVLPLKHCSMVLSPSNNWIREIFPLTPIFQDNNCFKIRYLEITFTFDMYFGTSWIDATGAHFFFYKYLTQIFFPWMFGQFFICPLQVLIKIEQNPDLCFFYYRNPFNYRIP